MSWVDDLYARHYGGEISLHDHTHMGTVGDASETTAPEQPKRNKYMREIAPGVWVDVYDVLYAFQVTDPCLQHLIKKALATGLRGHKSTREDLIDIRDSAIRAIEHFDLLTKAE